ncbi:hypothetical protein, partial [Streptomyces mirabilis]|uniref:hypothetical protein n=1 Tax=Streptomyces mirabilis TaxID=68239 RepID=UPI00380BC153
PAPLRIPHVTGLLRKPPPVSPRDITPARSVAALGAILSARLLYQWIRGRTQVQLARLTQQGASDRVRALPPGSKVTERRAGEELRIEVGAAGGDARD